MDLMWMDNLQHLVHSLLLRSVEILANLGHDAYKCAPNTIELEMELCVSSCSFVVENISRFHVVNISDCFKEDDLKQATLHEPSKLHRYR